MKRLIVAAMFCAASLFSAGSVSAAGAAFESEFGKSLPPIGFVKFCVSNPRECKQVGRRVQRIVATQDMWAKLQAVNVHVNSAIAPMSDQDLYGEAELWTYPVDAGDCEDYLLMKKRELEKLGFDAGALLITVVLDEKNDGHAVLTVATDQGDYILDNRRSDIMLWDETGYTFLKRQSQKDPRAWVALTNSQQPTSTATAGN
jgi:predicted transglutaminase-like cysteine proteinase